MRVMAVRYGEFFTEIGAVDMVEGIVAAERGRTAGPIEVGPEPRARIVGIVAVHHCAARPVVAVEILAVARRGPQREASGLPEPPQRRQRSGGALPLVGIVGRIETVGAEAAVLPAGLEIEESEPPRLVGRTQEGVAVGEIGVVPVAVAAAVGTCGEQREAARSHGARKVGVSIPVLAARTLETQVGRPEGSRADIDRPGVGPDARHAVQQIDGRNAVEIDRKRVGLVPGAGVRKINAVEKDHRLVERASPNEDVGLHALAPAFADIDRRCEAQGGLQSLDGRCGLCFPVEKRGLRLYVARRGSLAARYADLVDPQRTEDGGRVGMLRRRTLRREQEDRHRRGEDSDGYMAVQARKGRPAFAAPTPEAGSLLCLDVFHLVFCWVDKIIYSGRKAGPAAPPLFKPLQR